MSFDKMRRIFCDKQFLFVTAVILLAVQACAGSPSAPTGPASTSPSGMFPSMTSTWTITAIPTEIPAADTPPPVPTAISATDTQSSDEVEATKMPEPGITVAPTVTAAAPDDFLSERYSIAMFDEMNGWAQRGKGVLITADGGFSWKDVTPDGVAASDEFSSAYFVDASTSWVVTTKTRDDYRWTFFRTGDGGRTWKSTAKPAPPYHGMLSFFDAQTGWILDASSCGAGSCEANLYRTTNGGETWELIHYTDPNKDDPNTIPYGGIKNGFAFSDARHGWLAGDIAVDGFVYLYATQDGGVTWQHQDIPMPPGAENSATIVSPPQFFTVEEGILPVIFVLDQPVQEYYATSDGGATWMRIAGVNQGRLECASLQDCWVWDGEMLNVSHDSFQTWVQISPNIHFGDTLVQLEFVNSTTGWALSRDVGGQSQLYRTNDGGKNWEPLFP